MLKDSIPNPPLRDSIPNPLRDSVLKISKKLKMSLAGKNSKDMAHWNTPLCSSVENDKIGGDLSFEMMDRHPEEVHAGRVSY